jgi:hypothetical protein
VTIALTQANQRRTISTICADGFLLQVFTRVPGSIDRLSSASSHTPRLPVVVQMAIVCALLVLASGRAGASNAPTTFQVVSPSNNAELSSYPVMIELAGGGSDKEFHAELNGVNVTRQFTPLIHGKRTGIFYRRHIIQGKNSFIAHDGASVTKVHFTFQLPAGVQLSSEPGPEYVAVQTRVIQGDPNQLSDYGVQVGSTTYWAPKTTYQNFPATGATGFQVVLLDRATGNLVSNTSFGTFTEVGALIFDSTVGTSGFYSGCSDYGCVVIIQSLQSSGSGDGDGVTDAAIAQAVSSVGGSDTLQYYPETSSYSLISSVSHGGHPLGASAYERILPTGSAVISGVLILDNVNAYTFASPSRVTFSTGTAPGSDSNTITVAGTQYTSDPVAAGQGGIQLVALNRQTLQLLFQKTYTPIDNPGIGEGPLNQLDSDLNSLQGNCPPRGDSCPLVFVSTIGTVFKPQVYDPLTDPPLLEAWYKVAHDLAALEGGTYSVFEQLNSGDDYALVGSFDSVNSFPAAEASSVISKAIQQAGASIPASNIRGELTLDHQYGYAPALSNLKSTWDKSTVSLLDAIALQPPTAWPYPQPGHPGQQAAYLYFSSSPVVDTCLCQDIRSAYANQNSYSSFSNWYTNVSLAQYPYANQQNPPFSEEDFTLLKDQLETELQYAASIQGYLNNISLLFSGQESSISLILSGDYATVEQYLYAPPPPSTNTALFATLTAVGGMASLASYFTPVGPAAQFAFDGVSVGMNVAASTTNFQSSSGSINEQGMLESTYADLSTDAVNYFADTSDQIGNFFALILTDWGRMEALGKPLQDQTIVWDTTVDGTVLQNFDRVTRKQYLVSLMAGVFSIDHNVNNASGGPPTQVNSGCDAFTVGSHPGVNGTTVWAFPSGPNGQTPSAPPHDGQWYDGYIFWDTPTCTTQHQLVNNGAVTDLFAPLDPNDTSKMGQYIPWFFINQTQIPVITWCGDNNPCSTGSSQTSVPAMPAAMPASQSRRR